MVIDVPAGINGLPLADFVRQADVLLMPVLHRRSISTPPLDLFKTCYWSAS